MFTFTYLAFILAFVCILTGLLILIQIRGKKTATALGGIFIVAAFWLAGNSCADLARDPKLLFFFSGLALLSATIGISLMLCFIEFFYYRQISKNKLILFFLPSIITALLAFGRYAAKGYLIIPGEPAQIQPGALYLFVFNFTFLASLYGFLILRKKYKTGSAKNRLQIKYIILGFILTATGGLIFDFILPILGEYRFYNVGPLFSIFLLGFTAYAILRHQLLDIKILLQKGIFYLLAFGLIIGFYILTILTFISLIPQNSNSIHIISSCLTIFLGLIFFPNLEEKFNNTTDRLFFKQKYNYPQAINELTDIINQNNEPTAILTCLADKLHQIFKPTNVHFLLPQHDRAFIDYRFINLHNLPCTQYEKKILDAIPNYFFTKINFDGDFRKEIDETLKGKTTTKGSIAVPVVSNQKITCLIILGPKLSDDIYYQQDFSLLNILAQQLAVAIERIDLFEQVKNYSQQLEQKVLERTKKIKQLQEEQTKIMMDISHQLQTPLTVIKGEIDFLQRELPDNSQLKIFEKSIDKVSLFINALLNLARLEVKGEEKEKIELNFSLLLEELTEYFEVMANSKNIIVIKQIESDLHVLGNKNLLEELVINLVSNAVKFIAPPYRIFIKLQADADNIILKIIDTGVGIATEELQNIFQRFYRAKSTANITEGTGLGLAFCKKIVDLHQGTIALNSESGKGTEVTVTLNKLK